MGGDMKIKNYLKRNLLFYLILVACLMICSGCSKKVPLNERPMYGNIPPTLEVQKINDEFINTIVKKAGSRERGAQKMISVAWYYYNKGDLTTAMKRFNQAWLLNPNESEVYAGFACIAAKKNNLDEAIDMNTQAIKLNPNSRIAYGNRGLDYFHRGDKYRRTEDIERAISDFTTAIENDPKYAQNYNDRAVCYAAIDEYDKCWSDVQKARELGYKVSPEFIEKLQKVSDKRK